MAGGRDHAGIVYSPRIVSLARPFAAFISLLSKPLPWMRQTL